METMEVEGDDDIGANDVIGTAVVVVAAATSVLLDVADMTVVTLTPVPRLSILVEFSQQLESSNP